MARFNYNILNPQTISDLTPREMKQAYSELRSIARKRADRLEAQGYGAVRFPQVKQIMHEDLADLLAELSYYLRSGQSQLKIVRAEKEQATLAEHGYIIQDVREFGRFMDEMRYRYRNRKLPDSGTFADIYKQAERRKMSVNTLEREFGKWLDDAEEAEKLRDALEAAPARTKGRDRLTAKTLKNLL